MCNPRRVEVTATRELAEAWEHEVRRVATRSAHATGESRVREPLDGAIGAPVLGALAAVLSGADGWERDGDTFRHALDGGYLAYHADTQELEIVATASGQVDVAVTSSVVLHGEVRERIEATGTGRYYDDNWGGVTEADARQAADRDAEANLQARRLDVLRAARAEEEARRGADLDATVGAQADAELARRTAARTDELRAEAARCLTAVGIQGRNAFHAVLAQAYREAILAYARRRGADRISCSEDGGVLEIEFEMQV
jgi:hypothetical protein